MTMKPGEYIMTAARKQAEGEVATHIANIKVYQTRLLKNSTNLLPQMID